MRGLAGFGIVVLTYDTHQHAEEAFSILKNPARLYNQNYRVFVNRDIQVLWAEPFFDLKRALAEQTRHVILSEIPLNVSMRNLEEEISCFGTVERIRKYSDWAVICMKTVPEAKALLQSKSLLVDGKKWDIHPAQRRLEDPQEPDKASLSDEGLEARELTVLQLSTADRQRLYEVIQASKAYPATDTVRGLSHDLLNKARRLLQQSRRPAESKTAGFLLTEDNKPVAVVEALKHPRYYDPQIAPEPAAYSGYIPGVNERLPHTPLPPPQRPPINPMTMAPDQMQGLTMEQKMQYYYYLNNQGTPNKYPPYIP